MLFDEKIIDFERFFGSSTPKNDSHIKRMDMDIIYNISDKCKKMKVFSRTFVSDASTICLENPSNFSKSALVQALWEALYKSM